MKGNKDWKKVRIRKDFHRHLKVMSAQKELSLEAVLDKILVRAIATHITRGKK